MCKEWFWIFNIERDVNWIFNIERDVNMLNSAAKEREQDRVSAEAYGSQVPLTFMEKGRPLQRASQTSSIGKFTLLSDVSYMFRISLF